MALRTRLRRAFTRGSQDEGTSKTKTKGDPNVYQPGEKMPPLKYRRPVAPEHKAKLEAYDWAKAWRRRSDCSQYSPMGSRIPSRKASKSSMRSNRRSMSVRRKSSRGNDGTAVDSAIGGSIASEMHLREDSEEEGDITNVGLSRNPTEDPKRPRRKSSSVHRRSASLGARPSSRPPTSERTARRSANGPRPEQPFTQEELELALQRSQLEAVEDVSDRSNDATPGQSSPKEHADSAVAGMALRPRETLAVA